MNLVAATINSDTNIEIAKAFGESIERIPENGVISVRLHPCSEYKCSYIHVLYGNS